MNFGRKLYSAYKLYEKEGLYKLIQVIKERSREEIGRLPFHIASFFPNNGKKILNREWDILFILDSARKDMFSQVNDIPGDMSEHTSLGSETGLFLERNFTEENYEDIVYVTANPRVDNLVGDKFHDVYSVWRWEWDDEESTVRAEEMIDYCKEAIRKNPDKKVICHFLEPHLSIYDTKIKDGEIVDLEGESRQFSDKNPLSKFLKGRLMKQFPGRSPWVHFSEDNISKEKVWELQEDRLKRGISAIREVLESCADRKCVITSDHGNAYGEKVRSYLPWRVYEHPPNVRTKELVEVPWYEVELDK